MTDEIMIPRLALPPALAILVALWSSDAYAYLDPGTGSMILQILLGGAAGALVAGKLYWYKIKLFLGLVKEPTASEETKPADRSRST